MEIIINDERKIFAVQKEFSDMFPYLKLEFFSKPNTRDGAPSKKLMKHISKSIAECRTIHNAGHVKIQPQMTIGELEQGFRDVYGLSIDVLRKSGETWLETNATADWTLTRQDEEGRKQSQMQVV